MSAPARSASGDRLGTDIGVGADHPPHQGRYVHAGVRSAQLGLEQRLRFGGAKVVAEHDRHLRRPQAELPSQIADRVRRAGRVGGAEVADDADAMRQAPLQDRRSSSASSGS
jgi:hypothetical protein